MAAVGSTNATSLPPQLHMHIRYAVGLIQSMSRYTYLVKTCSWLAGPDRVGNVRK